MLRRSDACIDSGATPEAATRPCDYSLRAPEAFTTLAHFVISDRT